MNNKTNTRNIDNPLLYPHQSTRPIQIEMTQFNKQPAKINMMQNQVIGDAMMQQNMNNHQNQFNGNTEGNYFKQMGFGLNYFDASADKVNIPVLQERDLHGNILFVNLLLLVGLTVGVIGIVLDFLQIFVGVVIIVLTSLIYLCVSFGCNELTTYINNIKQITEYQSLYEKMKTGRGYFKFNIQCYHYVSSRRRKGGSSRRKVVTHTASQEYNLKQCFDQSGNIQKINFDTRYAFCKYQKKFYFQNPYSQELFIQTFNEFVARNRSDSHQSYNHDFKITGYEPKIAFSKAGEGKHNKIVFYVLTFIGLGWIYTFVFQRMVTRYEINIVKRLS